jgi:hypothetical protein
LLAEAEAEVEVSDRDMAQIVEATARRIAIESVGGPPSLIGDLGRVARIERRASAVDSVATARRALARLQGDTAAARIELSRVRWQVTAAVEAILGAHAEGLAAELVAAEEIARDLRHSLTGLSRCWFSEASLPPAPRTAMPSGGIGRVVKLPPAAVRILRERPLNDPLLQQSGNRDPAAEATRGWMETVAKLMDAEMPGGRQNGQ